MGEIEPYTRQLISNPCNGHAQAAKKVRVCRGLGSRHVAAVAVTANPDALALTISESSANITVFANGAALLELERPSTS
jgi:DNA integrity scanning protein DisA with diadenylate cyclase activity